MKNNTNKSGNTEDQIIGLNGQIADRKRAEQRLAETKSGRGKEDLTPDEDETLDELKARLAARAAQDERGELVKSLRGTVTNFLRARKRRQPQILAKSLRSSGERLVLPRKLRG